jgi:Polysaccharide pyruvyl transferase
MNTPRRLRLLHFDINTVHQYGDQLLFECVRQVFNGFGDGRYFDLTSSYPLRNRVGPKLVDSINSEYDGVVVGGGGLFLTSTVPNSSSGWQWDSPIEMLDRLRKPIIVFGVGYNRLYKQADFPPVFPVHLSKVIDQSVFFGLRNHGSVESIRSYVDAERGGRVTFQPCPTTFGRHLFPDLITPHPPERHLGLQIGLAPGHLKAGFTPDRIFPPLARVVRRLQAEEWRVSLIAHRSHDLTFSREHANLGLAAAELFGRPDVLFDGPGVYSSFPLVVGGRGHAQLITFGVGSVPLSIDLHPKLGFFATDVGHPEWVVDPLSETFEVELIDRIQRASASWSTLHSEILQYNDKFLDVTLDNLSSIYRQMTGVEPEKSFVPYSPRERRLAAATYAEAYRRTRLQIRQTRDAVPQVNALRSQLKDVRSAIQELAEERDAAVGDLEALKQQTDACRMLAEANRLARSGSIAAARQIVAAIEYLAPGCLCGLRCPRWSKFPWRFVPSPFLSGAIRIRNLMKSRPAGPQVRQSSRERGAEATGH